MFRKITHIIMALFLLVATTGVTFSKHYCGGELVSTSIFNEADPCCDSDDCCKNETEIYQLDEDFSVSTSLVVPESEQIDLLAISIVVFNLMIEENSIAEDYELIDSPPPPTIQARLALLQTYLC